MVRSVPLGIMFRCQYPPEALPDFAQRAEAVGFNELWVVEDGFFNGGISAAAAALDATVDLNVGIGILPAVVRNAAYAAMEFATLARLHPGRVLPGFGHGVGSWMRQVGAFPESQLGALEEITQAVRALLRGEHVTMHGQFVHLEGVELVHKPRSVPPLALGVLGPKSLRLSGLVADGTLIPELSSPAYVRWAKAQIAAGAAEAGRTEPHRLTVYAFCSPGADRAEALKRMRSQLAVFLASFDTSKQISHLPFAADVEALAARGVDAMRAEMPDEWITALTASGTPDECRAYVDALIDAGADAVTLVPLVDQPGDPVTALAEVLLE
ncbi:MAG TPA: LLM class flavin-dependent oxidoreductase [Candidatus Limnocylindrales bacterium]|nr:LLM class flavin-dependent oxidoreductase [Candidatus Limnocylindrales bacterium]